MGKNKDKKKKGKGMEKTIAKTEKKNEKRLKKELEEIGEDNIESLIAQFQQKDKELTQVKEEICSESPSPRTGASFSVDTERDEFILFGGEYFDGSKIYMYNDLYIYNIKKNQWSLLKAPNPPPPRSSHQAAYLARNQGELWVFGGEFASPTQSQFYHYNDLWVFRFATKQWEKINASNAPSPRSGHRMIIYKKYLLIFGGFHDNLRSCRYFNDTHILNLETNQWQELKFTSVSELPSPRSACQLVLSLKNNAVVVYGGYSKEKLKKDREKGVVHTDMYALSQETKKDGKIEWQWKRLKQTGNKPTERCSFSMITLLDDSAILFGGVYDFDDENDDDNEDEENIKSTFFNDLYKLDLGAYKWKHIILKGKKAVKKTKSSKKQTEESDIQKSGDESDEDEEQMDSSENTKVEADSEKLNVEEGVFALTINKSKPSDDIVVQDDVVITTNQSADTIFTPLPRRNAYLSLHKGYLYLYGGCFEAKNGKEITLTDMYCLNVKKFDEWKTLMEDRTLKSNDLRKIEELESNDENDDDDDDEDEDDDDEMEIDAPEIEDDEDIKVYFDRTKDFWIDEAKKEFPDEKSSKILKKMAIELCNMYYEAVNKNDDDEDNNKKDVASN